MFFLQALRTRAKKARAARKPDSELKPGIVIENVAQTRRLAETTLVASALLPAGSSVDDERPTNTGSGSQVSQLEQYSAFLCLSVNSGFYRVVAGNLKKKWKITQEMETFVSIGWLTLRRVSVFCLINIYVRHNLSRSSLRWRVYSIEEQLNVIFISPIFTTNILPDE